MPGCMENILFQMIFLSEVPRHFYDEIRIKGLNIEKGDIIKLQRDDQAGDNAGLLYFGPCRS